jgi:hypothetical protein
MKKHLLKISHPAKSHILNSQQVKLLVSGNHLSRQALSLKKKQRMKKCRLNTACGISFFGT